MFKLFILALTLFSILPTHAMRAIKSQSHKRGYATMTKQNFDTLLGNSACPAPTTEEFKSKLNTIKMDSEDHKKLLNDLEFNIKSLEQSLESNPLSSYNYENERYSLMNYYLMTATGFGLVLMESGSVILSNCQGAEIVFCLCAPIFLVARERYITKHLRNLSKTNTELQKNKANLAHVASLLNVKNTIAKEKE